MVDGHICEAIVGTIFYTGPVSNSSLYDILLLFQEAQRNTLLKDAMRETCVGDLVNSWYEILVSVNN